MHSRLLPFFIATSLLAMLAVAVPAMAQPGFPASYFGAVAVDGEPVPDGTDVRGYINGVDCTQLGENYRTTVTIDGVSQYAIEVVHESQREGCGSSGREVSFFVGGQQARETAEWQPGAMMVNLNVGTETGPTLPPPTPTSTLEPTAAAATATEEAQFTPISGTPPTDEVTLPVNTLEPGETPDPPAAGDEESTDGSGRLFFASIVVGLLILGVAGGTALARRNRKHEVEP